MFAIALLLAVLPCIINAAETCRVPECEFWEYKCNTGHCINLRFFCDGINDCPDGSDEIIDKSSSGCGNILNDANIQCKLPEQYHCDSVHHCQNKTDENEISCETNRHNMQCGKFGHCLNKIFINCADQPGYRCSNNILCQGNLCSRRGGFTEVYDLTKECESISTFRCNSGECLQPDQFCDGRIDCRDGSDEILANSFYVGDGISCSNKWNNVAKQCVLPSRYICDIIDHCDGRVDECQPECKHSFICGNGKCIWGNKTVPHTCDGKDDCGDSSDECNSICQGFNNVFHCNDEKKTCIAIELFCNGRKDCPDGSDEIGTVGNDVNATICANRYNPTGRRCLLLSHHMCDDVIHCEDQSDEILCSSTLGDNSHFTCRNNKTIYNNKVCDFKDDCCDSSDECGIPGCNRTFTCPNSGKCIAFDRFCDGNDDCGDGSDEIMVHTPGFMCNNQFNDFPEKCVLPQQYICDNLDHCVGRTDECNSDCSHSFFCNNGQCIHRMNFCDGTNHCDDKSDELSDISGFKCDVIQRFRDVVRTCVIPQNLLFDETFDCIDQSDSCSNNGSCFRCLNIDFYISTRQVCDGIFDCPDLSDECLCVKSNENVSQICKNYGLIEGKNCDINKISCDEGNKCINVSNICDGIQDCIDGLDENACKVKADKDWSSKSVTHDYTCGKHNSQGSSAFATECDGIPQCDFADDECKLVNYPDKRNNFLVNDEFVCGADTMEVCRKLKMTSGILHCPGKPHQFLSKEICDGVEDCDRITPDELSPDEQSCKDRVKCPRSRPKESRKSTIHVSSFCDATIDCEGEEDEAEDLCQDEKLQRFYCESRTLGDNSSMDPGPLFVTNKEVLDGKPDCKDGSDECPTKLFHDNLFSSRHRMIRNMILIILVWAIGLLALFGNIAVMCHTIAKLRSRRRFSAMMRSNYVLVFNLAAADFLMGVYLLALAIQNTKTDGSYCRYDREWRTGTTCSSLGSLAMISIQASVCFLVILTTYRLIAVLKPFRADSLKVRYTVVFVILTWFFALVIANVPRHPSFENYFISSVFISHGVYFFDTNTPKKAELEKFVTTLASYSNFTGPLSDSMTWQEIRHSLDSFYPTTWPEFRILGTSGYYSSNSVCLPRIFVKVNDSAWLYSFIIMMFDLASFVFILISYWNMYKDASQSGEIGENRAAIEENKTLQQRITRLVLADFVCIVPVCITAFISVLGVEIPPIIYAVAAIVFLPVNSALNPIFYSNIFRISLNFLKSKTITCRNKINKKSRKRRRKNGNTDNNLLTTSPDQHNFKYNRYMASVEETERLRLDSSTSPKTPKNGVTRTTVLND